MAARLRAGLAAAILAAGTLLACDGATDPTARFTNFTDTLALYALNGAPRGAPTAIRIYAGTITSPGVSAIDALLDFDVAVDIDAQGRPVLYPVRAVASPILGRHRVGLQKSPSSFDAILRAPTGGYTHDSVTVVSLGEVVLIESADPAACNLLFGGGFIYGKMVVDSVRVDTRRVYVRLLGDPNCNFRSLAPGTPED